MRPHPSLVQAAGVRRLLSDGCCTPAVRSHSTAASPQFRLSGPVPDSSRCLRVSTGTPIAPGRWAAKTLYVHAPQVALLEGEGYKVHKVRLRLYESEDPGEVVRSLMRHLWVRR